jgi:hypothetical protein
VGGVKHEPRARRRHEALAHILAAAAVAICPTASLPAGAAAFSLNGNAAISPTDSPSAGAAAILPAASPPAAAARLRGGEGGAAFFSPARAKRRRRHEARSPTRAAAAVATFPTASPRAGPAAFSPAGTAAAIS